ncbi:hypothetical protein EVAR_22732_1 [Eumeta japonica]|uniref:Uncharacterized protein n=1 Tax=Eumeta variegata TaxID=151549 RepID=A0A4C1USZ8_EUMVA|nr:hypothetical protein EVAR_22732_1 [Eumeta japonica]
MYLGQDRVRNQKQDRDRNQERDKSTSAALYISFLILIPALLPGAESRTTRGSVDFLSNSDPIRYSRTSYIISFIRRASFTATFPFAVEQRYRMPIKPSVIFIHGEIRANDDVDVGHACASSLMRCAGDAPVTGRRFIGTAV